MKASLTIDAKTQQMVTEPTFPPSLPPQGNVPQRPLSTRQFYFWEVA